MFPVLAYRLNKNTQNALMHTLIKIEEGERAREREGEREREEILSGQREVITARLNN